MSKTIFILIDGCGFDLAKKHCGFLECAANSTNGTKYKVNAELPSMSRPIYETLFTGIPVLQHGIHNNMISHPSDQVNLFSLCRNNKLKTAASAYYWISELYGTSPFRPEKDRIQLPALNGNIDNGIYYFEDDYPDSHTLADGAWLKERFDPDFLFIHTMNVDYAGHIYGAGSKEQAAAAVKIDTVLSAIVPGWIEEGYNIIVTGDHGMDEHGLHGGNSPIQREVPLYLFGDRFRTQENRQKTITQLLIAPLLCAALEIKAPDHMMNLEEMEDLFCVMSENEHIY